MTRMTPKNDSAYPYRPNVQMWVFNAEGKILFNDESTKDEIYWKFPQGGVDAGETHVEAVKRELQEEVNITDYTIIAQAPFTHRYEWDEKRQHERKLRGQEQTFYLIQVHNPSQLRIGEPNIRSSKWMTFEQILAKMTISNQIEIAKKVWKEFLPLIENELTNTKNKRLLAEVQQAAIDMTRKKYQTIIFDVGGTLINSQLKMKLILENPVEYKLLKQHYPALQYEDYVSAIEALLEEKIDYTTEKDEYGFNLKIQEKMGLKPSIKLAKAMREAYDQFEKKILSQITAKNAIPLLDYLHAQKYQLGIISNSTRELTTDWLECIGKKHYFSTIVLSHEVKMAKPQKEIFQYCLTQLQANPSTTLMIGDMEGDLGAKAIGMKTCILDYGQGVSKWKERPDFIIKDLIKIKEILGERTHD